MCLNKWREVLEQWQDTNNEGRGELKNGWEVVTNSAKKNGLEVTTPFNQ